MDLYKKKMEERRYNEMLLQLHQLLINYRESTNNKLSKIEETIQSPRQEVKGNSVDDFEGAPVFDKDLQEEECDAGGQHLILALGLQTQYSEGPPVFDEDPNKEDYDLEEQKLILAALEIQEVQAKGPQTPIIAPKLFDESPKKEELKVEANEKSELKDKIGVINDKSVYEVALDAVSHLVGTCEEIVGPWIKLLWLELYNMKMEATYVREVNVLICDPGGIQRSVVVVWHLQRVLSKNKNPVTHLLLIEEVIQECEQYFSVFKVQDNKKAAIAGMHLEGTARKWFLVYAGEENSFVWSEVYKYFPARFGDWEPELYNNFKQPQNDTTVELESSDIQKKLEVFRDLAGAAGKACTLEPIYDADLETNTRKPIYDKEQGEGQECWSEQDFILAALNGDNIEAPKTLPPEICTSERSEDSDNLSHTQVIKDMNIHTPLLNMTPSQLEEKIINGLYLYCPTLDGFQQVFKQACQYRRTKEELAINQPDRVVEYGDRAKSVGCKGKKTHGVAKEESLTVPINMRELLRNVLCGDRPTSSNSVGLEQKLSHLNKKNMLVYDPGWSSFMNGRPLTPLMIDALVSLPASSLAELKKIYEIAVQGSDDDKISAAAIFCGASLIRGWNMRGHTVYFNTKLLGPPVPANNSRTESHLIHYAPMLYVILVGMASVDCVQIFFVHGVIPQLAGSLMPICEVFGSCETDVIWTLTSEEEISAYAVFSNAFALLLKLWRFTSPPIEHGVGDVPPVGSQLTPEYLLLVRNSNNKFNRALVSDASSSFSKPVFMESFPKLKIWYRQHLACIASPLSGLVHGTPVHKIVEDLLCMMFKKISKEKQSMTSGSSASSGTSEETSLRPKLAAWGILEAVPFVVDAALTACAHGRLSPRELCTGLKDLADFLPASLAAIVSYFSAEVSRGVWKHVSMNGVDWPSPAANLSNVEEQIKKILAATGVDVPSLVAGRNSPATLPLPLAAFVSLTITYKIDNASQRFLNLAGPALESLAAGCPWPCMPIVASLWTQKAKRWTGFLVFSASRTVFLHNKDAVVQLLRSCFNATLGLKSSSIPSNGGVGALLGHGFGYNSYGEITPVSPGILYLRTYRSIRDIMFMREEIVSALMQSVSDIACNGLPRHRLEKQKKAKFGMKYGQVSLATALTKVKVAASLGASLICFGGLALVQSLIKETLPSWFISVHNGPREEDSGVVATLGGYALAYFSLFCGSFAFGLDSSSLTSKHRKKILQYHLEFVASALDGKISLGCSPATWHAYVISFVSLMVRCVPTWVLEVDAEVLKRISNGLRHWNEEELALSLLVAGGIGTMGAAAEQILETGYRSAGIKSSPFG